MSIYLFNSLTKKKQKFISLKQNELKIYSCGPTVYSQQHIGNLRSVIIWDILKNIFKYNNYKIIDVINITDVGHLISDEDNGEDKMLKASKKENLDPYKIAEKYENIYFEDLKKLNITFSKFFPRASKHIKEQLEIIEKLDKNNLIYKTKDGIYFDTQKYKNYGVLTNKNIDEKDLKNRTKKNDEKKHPFDFALWKFCIGENKNHLMNWKSKYGIGFPGWHIECSAMGKKYLGEKFDIHTGGIEHKSVHHECEIAQNIGSCKNSKINFWLHNNHLILDGEKMSKSFGNCYVLNDLEKKNFSAIDFRFYCLKFHYREIMNFTFEGLEQSFNELKKIRNFVLGLKNKKFIGTNDNELVDGFDKNNNLILKKISRKEIRNKKDLIKRAVDLFIVDKNNNILLEKRSKYKKSFPSKLSKTCGGCVSSGEEIFESLIREVKEEIGIILKKNYLDKKIKPNLFQFSKNENEWNYCYFLKLDLTKKDLKIQEEEIEEIVEIPIEKFEKEFWKNREKFIPTEDKYWKNLFLELKELKKKIPKKVDFVKNTKIEKEFLNFKKEFENLICDDMKTNLAISKIFEFQKFLNKEFDNLTLNEIKIILNFYKKIDEIFRLNLFENKIKIPKNIIILAEKRKKFRLEKNFKMSDELRNEILKKGYFIKDDKENNYIVGEN